MNTGDQHHVASGLDTAALPSVTDRDTWQAELDKLRVREKAHTRATMRWRALRSPSAQPARRPAYTDLRIPRLESLAEIVALVALASWLWFAYTQHVLLFGPALDAYQFAPIWQQVALPTLLVLGASVAQAAINLLRPEWVRM